MSGTVDDFMSRFGGSNTVDDRDAAKYHDRFVSTASDDHAFDRDTYHQSATEYLGKLPDDQFHEATRTAYEQAPPQEKQGLLSTLMGALGGGGGGSAAGGLGGLAGMLGLGSSDPQNLSGDDYAKLMSHARRQNPQVIQQTVQEKPWFVKAMGNPIVMGALTMAAAKMVSNQRKGKGLF